MKQRCIDAVSAILGRQLKAGEGDRLEARIIQQKQILAGKDNAAYLAMGESQRLYAAADAVAKEIQLDAGLKKIRVINDIKKASDIYAYSKAKGGLLTDNLESTAVFIESGSMPGFQSADSRAEAIKSNYFRQISSELEAFGPKALGLVSNDKAMSIVFRELRGENTGVPEAKAFATKIKAIFDSSVDAYRAAGGKVGTLEDFGNPQSHSKQLVFKETKQGWVEFIKPLLNTDRHYFKEDGARFTDAEMTDFLGHAWHGIVYEGRGDSIKTGSGKLANSRDVHRQLHFKDAESYLKYHSKFSHLSLISTIANHIDGISKDIALLETYGSNPDHMVQILKQKAFQEAEALNIAPEKIDDKLRKFENTYNALAGITPVVYNPKIARAMGSFRNYLNIRLGSAGITALFTDPATAIVTAGVWNLKPSKFLLNELKLLSDADARRQARRLGLGVDSFMFILTRLVQDDLGSEWSHKISGAVVRAGGLSYVTEAAKQAFGILMMDGFGYLSRTVNSLADLHPGDKLLTKGLTEEQFQIWKQAPLEDFLGSKLLTYDGIMSVKGVDEALKREAALKLLSIVIEESDIAIVTPGTKERATLYGTANRGTLLGEVGYSFAKFKSFPLAMITRHYRRASHMPGMARAKYIAALISMGILGGAMSTQLNELANFRDPLEMDNPSFLMRALLKSGALSFYGDFIQASETQYGQGYLGALGGPVVGAFEEFLNLTLKNAVTAAQQAAEGKPIKTDVGAEAIRFIKGMTPGTSIWWAKGLLDHGIIQNLQEEASPGYLRRMEKRAKKNYGQRYFGKPGKLPRRAPDFNRAIGQ